MKKSLLLAFVLAFTITSTIVAKTITINPEVQSAIVYLNQAYLTRQANLNIIPGQHTLVMSGLPSHLSKENIQVKGKGDFTILNTSFQHNYLRGEEYPAALQPLADSVELVQNAIDQVALEIDVLNKGQQMILSNQKIGGEGSVTASELKLMADFFKSRLTSIGNELLKLKAQQKDKQEVLDRLKRQLQSEKQRLSENNGEIRLAIDAHTSGPVTLQVSYLVYNAGWNPYYDLRVNGTDGPLSLDLKAKVYQSTGETWKGISLVLSSNDPQKGGTQPELNPWYVDFYEPARRPPRMYMMEERAADQPAALSKSASVPGPEVNKTQQLTGTQYEIAQPYDLPGDGNEVAVDIQHYEPKAKYQYFAVPKYDQEAFLTAQVADWEQMDLLAGQAQIYSYGNYIGTSFIDPQNTDEEMIFSLGRDPRIKIERKKVKDLTDTKIIGGTKTEVHAYEVTVKNTLDKALALEMEDQVPVSKQDAIKVEVREVSGGQLNAETGKVSWQLDLPAKGTKTVKLSFEVKYPKDKRVSNL